MTKCICGIEIAPDNVHYHQGCGTKIFQDSDMTIPSINQMVAENKQRAIPFPSYTGEVVDFLLANIETLTKDRDELSIYYATVKNEACGFIAQNKALAKENEETKQQHNLDLDDYMESYIRLEAKNAALSKENAVLEQHHHITETAIGVARLKMKNTDNFGAKEVLDDCCDKLDLLDKQALAEKE